MLHQSKFNQSILFQCPKWLLEWNFQAFDVFVHRAVWLAVEQQKVQIEQHQMAVDYKQLLYLHIDCPLQKNSRVKHSCSDLLVMIVHRTRSLMMTRLVEIGNALFDHHRAVLMLLLNIE